MLPRPLAQLPGRSLALLCVAVGLLGVFLPGLPAVPFLLMAAWAGGRGWPRAFRAPSRGIVGVETARRSRAIQRSVWRSYSILRRVFAQA